MRTRPVCIACRRRPGNVVPLPITGKKVSLCDRCRGPAFLMHMAGLVAHGVLV